MSRRAKRPKLELKLNLSPPRTNQLVDESPTVLASSCEMSPKSSCVSLEPEDTTSLMDYTKPEANLIVLAGCPRCFMYVMLSDVHPKCPKCKSTVLLDFLNQENTKKTDN